MNGLLDFSDFSVFVGSSFLFMWKIKGGGRNFQTCFPKFATPAFPLLLDPMLRICPENATLLSKIDELSKLLTYVPR